PPARDLDRPHAVRRQLERAEPERRQLRRRRREAHRRARVRQGRGLAVITVLAVSGSLRAGSHNTSLLEAAAEAAPEGVEVELFEQSGIADLPAYDQDLDTAEGPESVTRLREAWGAADAILFATPEYNGSIPGGLKNAIDWASRPRLEAALTGKTVAV